MNKEWSNTQKEAMILINKRSTFESGIKKLIWLRTVLFNQWINSMKDIAKEDYSKMPFPCHKGYESKTIGYSIYHVFRIEDIVLNSLIIN
ncbi:MAG: phage head-tail adapter protein, partial [Bacilli bacterium]